MPQQESFSKLSSEMEAAFGNIIPCPDCEPTQLMRIKDVYPALYCGRDIIFCQCTACGAEKTEVVTQRLLMRSLE